MGAIAGAGGVGARLRAVVLLLVLPVVLLLVAPVARAIDFDPCSEVLPVTKGEPFVVGLAYWPGGLLADWGDEPSSSSDPNAAAPSLALHPCNATDRMRLEGAGVHFAAFAARADRLSALKTTFPEQLYLTGANPDAAAPRVISVVAFRHKFRSEARYVASFDPQITSGTGFAGSLSLVAAFDPPGRLSRLLWWNMTCNDCGGRASARCLDGTACAVPSAACSCGGVGGSASRTATTSASADAEAPAAPTPSRRRRLHQGDPAGDAAAAAAAAAAALPSTSSSPAPPASASSSCDYGSMGICAAAVNLAFDGADAKSRAFTTAAAIRNLNSYSLLRLYSAGKDRFFAAADAWSGPVGDAWGKFREGQSQLADAYREDPDGARVTGAQAGATG